MNLAAVCKHEGELNVVLISKEGSILNYFESTDVGNRWFVTWAPGNSILYQLPGNKNFNFLDPDTEKEKPFLNDTSRGWIFSALISPDQKKAVFFVNWQRHEGIWVQNLLDHHGGLLAEVDSDTEPFGWSSDSKWVYLKAGASTATAISKINIDTKKEIALPQLDFGRDNYITGISMAQDEKTFAATISEYESDVWITENFDPDTIHE